MNRLARETSPYLRDHAEQPVDWYPWGPEAWERARHEDRPIFLSIGYSACHWCHVMASESFEDEEVAQILNDGFISIKVDREERPDVDEIYIEAVRLLTSSAGWPLSVFLTPDLKPFYGGSYYPPKPRHGLPAFRRVLNSVLAHYHQYRAEIDKAGDTITEKLAELSVLPKHEGELKFDPLERFYRQRLEAFDSEHGGFGIAPKFPNPTDLILLLRLSRLPGFDQALPMAELTLRKMAQGGINDQLGGGFHRYSTDTIWLVPHFEKMLYDNAQLGRAYAEAFSCTGEESYRAVALETLAFLEREMKSPEGGFCSSLDADADGTEGSFYIWTRDEIEARLGPELTPLACDFFGISPAGSFHGRNVLRFAAPADVLMRVHGLPPEQLWPKLDEIKSRLNAVRGRRRAPHRDDKLLADWNGLALSAFSRAHVLLEEDHLLDVARGIASYFRQHLISGSGIRHCVRPGQADVPGTLADYAFTANGFLDLYDAGFNVHDLLTARTLVDRMAELFGSDRGGFFTTAPDTAGLLTRTKGGYDGSIPSGNSMAALALLRLARLTGESEYERLGAQTIRFFYRTMGQYPSAFSVMLTALDYLLHPGTELVMFLPPGDVESKPMLAVARSRPDPYRTMVVVSGTEADEQTRQQLPLVRDRCAIDGRATAYLCQGYSCLTPAHRAQELEGLLDRTPGPVLDTPDTGSRL